MLKKILILSLVATIFACGSQTDTQTLTLSGTDNTPIETPKNDTAVLTFHKFQDTKWIVGEVGVNGERPDTIIFTKPDTLTYVSTDTGKELCHYSFDKDTLIYYSTSARADMNSLDDLTCETMNKLHYQNETFRYIYFEEKCTGDKVAKRIRMDTLDVKFRRL
jgi:hypothetical protein